FVKHRAFGDKCRAVNWAIYYTVMLVFYVYMYSLIVQVQADKEINSATYGGEDGSFLQSRLSMYKMLLWAAVIAMIAPGVCNRMAMRKKFDIPHKVPEAAGWGDSCLWFWCNSCALCQETRTIIHNNVEDGLWKGPDVVAVEPVGGAAFTAETAPMLPCAPPQREAMAAPRTAQDQTAQDGTDVV
ncbi:unnamed protein product, partial [Ostreobium quekettii]